MILSRLTDPRAHPRRAITPLEIELNSRVRSMGLSFSLVSSSNSAQSERNNERTCQRILEESLDVCKREGGGAMSDGNE